MKYPYRVDMEQNGVIWSVLVKNAKDKEYYDRNNYVLVQK